MKLRHPSGTFVSFIDNGADSSFIKPSVFNRLTKSKVVKPIPSSRSFSAANRATIIAEHECDVPFLFNGVVHFHRLIVAPDLHFRGALLLGNDFLSRFKSITDWGKRTISFKGENFKFKRADADDSMEGIKLIRSHEPRSIRLRTRGVHTVPAGTIACVRAAADIVPQDKIEILVEDQLHDRFCRVGKSINSLDGSNSVNVHISNLGRKDLVLSNNAYIASACVIEEVSESLPSGTDFDVSPKSLLVQESELDAKLKHLSPEQRRDLLEVINKNTEAFSVPENPIGCVEGFEASIDTPPEAVAYKPQYRTPQAHEAPLGNIIKELVTLKVIEPCAPSGFNSPVILVKKPGNRGFRFVADLRGLNELTTLKPYPIPRVSELINSLHGSRFFSILDAKMAYYNIPLREEDRHKTCFQAAGNTYRFRRLVMGLKNSAFHFQRMMHSLFEGTLGVYAAIYLDDLIVHSKTFADHLRHLSHVFSLLIKGGLRLSLEKCQFARQELKFLGFIVDGKSSRPTEEGVRAIKEFPAPKSPKALKRFLGMVTFFRSHLKSLASMTAPLTDLLKKDSKFVWKKVHEDCFNKIKDALCSFPSINHADFSKPFTVHTDASKSCIGACLMQTDDENNPCPVAYYSRKLRPPEQRWSCASEFEALAIVEALKNFDYYLRGREFTVVTDHLPLKRCFRNNQIHNARIARWIDFLNNYSFTTEYKKGKDHVVPDAISRADLMPISTNALGIANVPEFRNAFSTDTVSLRQASEDPWKDIVTFLKGGKVPGIPRRTALDQFRLVEGVLYFSGKCPKNRKLAPLRLVVPPSLIKQALAFCHSSGVTVHAGYMKTIRFASSLFYWPSMYSDLRTFISKCDVCQKRKAATTSKAEVGAMPAVSAPMQRVGIDLIGRLPESKEGHCYILCITDHFSRFTWLKPLKSKTKESMVKAFTEFTLENGTPISICADRGTEQRNELFLSMCQALGTKIRFTTAYRAMSNGSTENRNREVGNLLAFFLKAKGGEWCNYLRETASSLNASHHSTIGDTPFFVHHGRDFQYNFAEALNQSEVTETDIDTSDTPEFVSRLQQRVNEAYAFVARNAAAAKTAADVRYNKAYRAHSIKEGSLVLVRNETRTKFEDRYKGPYRVIRLIGLANAVIIPIFAANPSTIKEDVVHTDRLKPFVSNGDAFPGWPPPRQEMPVPEEDTDEEPPDEDPDPTDDVETSELPERSDKYALRARPSAGSFLKYR